MTPARIAGLVGLVGLAAACGADRAATPVSTEPPAGAITKITDTGSVKITVELWPPAPRLSDPIHLRLTAESRAGVSVDLPFQAPALGRFKVSAYDRSERRTGDARVQVQNYMIEAPSSGRHRIPAFRLEVAGAPGGGAAARPTEVLTEEIPLEVSAIDDAATSRALPASRGTLPTRVGGWPWWAWGLVILGVVWVGLAVLIVLRLGARRAVRRRISAYDHAVARLRALEDAGAPAGAAADAWFVELSAVIRGYLEARYDIRAPELTTEEFLHQARRAADLSAEHRELLSAFMARCDRVKFAGYRPEADESLASLRAARGFVEDTRLVLDPGAVRRRAA